MVRALGNSIERPADFVSALNQCVIDTGVGASTHTVFSFSLLTLYPTQERFSYISCGYVPLWYIPSGADSPRRLTADNTSLGIPTAGDFMEVDGNFNIGDTLVLHTFQAGSAKSVQEIEFDEAQFLEALLENLFFSPQTQVDAIFRKVSQKEGRNFFERPVTVIGIERVA